MPEPPRNRCPTSEMVGADLDAAIDRIRVGDAALADEVEHVVDSLTWGEGLGVIRQAGLQEWLWYVVPTKYVTDEVGYMGRLAETAAVLFDELGLDAYAAICRSDETVKVYAAFERSDSAGRSAFRKAIERSGIDPPNLVDFEWGSVMRIEEAQARSAIEAALEQAIVTGRMTPGARRWRTVQAEVAAEVLDGDHPEMPGKSWRTAVVTERIEQWVSDAEARSPELAGARAEIANRLLHPVDTPATAEPAVEPLVWLLTQWGDEQPLTQAGYLKPAFVQSLQRERPWDDQMPLHRPVKNENDDVVLHQLRGWLQRVGAVRKHKSTMRRSPLGREMADDWQVAWATLARHLGGDGWDGFVAETAAVLLLGQAGPMSGDAIVGFTRSAAIDMGWQSTADGVSESPSIRDVHLSFANALHTWGPCGLIDREGDWRNRRYAFTETGDAAASAYLRHVAAGPKGSPT